MSPWLFPVIAVVVGAVAATMDYRTGRIPNKLTFPVMLLGLVAHSAGHGIAGFLGSSIGLIVCAAVPGVVYKASQGRGIGGGDIKLFAALGALLGPTQGLEVELSSFLLLGVFALFRLAFLGQLGRTLVTSLCVSVGLFIPSLKTREDTPSSVMTEMRMGPAIAVGVVTVLALPYLMRCLPWLG
jgi:prepilin peptidase CpaA